MFNVKNFAIVSLVSLASVDTFSRENTDLFPHGEDIIFPKNFKSEMSLIGSWFIPDGVAAGFHNVYMDKKSIKEYRDKKVIPNGTMIVKELLGSNSGNYTTGQDVVYTNDNVKQYFVMIKDSENRFSSKSSSWGDGWGWGLFKPESLDLNSSSNYRTDCLGCHIPASNTDFLYKEAYPLFEHKK
ncbi:hypothetical protein A9261_15125 [Vibrio tasmaniensis]|nr:hypothetical protein A9261_15125 [Vibrio tasmaniensis]